MSATDQAKSVGIDLKSMREKAKRGRMNVGGWADATVLALIEMNDQLTQECNETKARVKQLSAPVTQEEFHSWCNQTTYEFSEDAVNKMLQARALLPPEGR